MNSSLIFKRFSTLILIFAGAFMLQAQRVSCSDLVEYVQSEDSYPDRVNTINSSMLVKAEYYRVNDGGLVIA